MWAVHSGNMPNIRNVLWNGSWPCASCVFLQSLLSTTSSRFGEFEDDLSDNLEGFAGVSGDSWEEWEEWMGWEGAGTRNYSNHVNYATWFCDTASCYNVIIDCIMTEAFCSCGRKVWIQSIYIAMFLNIFFSPLLLFSSMKESAVS